MALGRLSLLKSGAFLNETGTSLDDEFKSLLEAASDWAARYCGRWEEGVTVNAFELNTYEEERYTGTGGHKLFLRHYPVVNINEVRIWDGDDSFDVESADKYELINRRYIQYPSLESTGATWSNWPELYMNGIKVTYTAGYTSVNWDTLTVAQGFGVPPDLEYAVCAIAHLSWKQGTRSGGRRGVLTLSMGVESMSADKFLQGLSEEVISILDNYKVISL